MMRGNPGRDQIDSETGEIMDATETQMGGGRTAGDLISAGSQILQIRTKSQLLVAIQRPRDVKSFEVKLLAMAAEAGEDFFYFIQYKDGTVIEGPGVGLARAAAQLWGNCSVDTRIEQETPEVFLVRSDFVDFETNYTRSETKRVSKLIARKGGYVRATDKALDLVYQQGASKVERDCILRSLPKHVIERAFELAKVAALQEKAPIPQQIARIVRRFGELKIGMKQVERYIGCAFTLEGIKAAEKNAAEVCASLRGLITAIKGGDTSIDEAFTAQGPAPETPESSKGPGAITPADVAPPAKPPVPPGATHVVADIEL